MSVTTRYQIVTTFCATEASPQRYHIVTKTLPRSLPNRYHFALPGVTNEYGCSHTHKLPIQQSVTKALPRALPRALPNRYHLVTTHQTAPTRALPTRYHLLPSQFVALPNRYQIVTTLRYQALPMSMAAAILIECPSNKALPKRYQIVTTHKHVQN